MKSPRTRLRFFILASVLAFSGHRAAAADSPELTEARAQLLEAYKNGETDSANRVKQLREKIAAMEYVARAELGASAPAATKPVNVDFPGGPLSTLIATINKEGGGLNVVGERADLALALPAFSIRNADGNAVAGALMGLLQPRGFTLQGGGRVSPGQSPVYVLRKLFSHELNQFVQFQSFQLGPYLEQQGVDDIVSAMRAAWELDPAHDATVLRLKFHPGTGILLVSAPPDGIQVVQIVLQQLRKGSDPAMRSGQKSPAAPATEKR